MSEVPYHTTNEPKANNHIALKGFEPISLYAPSGHSTLTTTSSTLELAGLNTPWPIGQDTSKGGISREGHSESSRTLTEPQGRLRSMCHRIVALA